ncbi:MAG: hypothetical protein H0T46_19340 [Deltaproteobacteria bacterium]|nr:hypothetical protein [Deltaproteobacteria bacterium]
MTRTAFILSLAFATGCGGAAMHEVSLINKSPRPITEVYVYPTGSSNQGASKGTLAPEGTMKLKVKAGNVDVLAVSAKVKIDDTQSETRRASQTLELKAPVSLVFHDSNQTPPGLDKHGTIGVSFQVIPEAEPPAQPEEAGAPPIGQ